MNPDCEYCGLKDGENIEHICDPRAMERVIDNLYAQIRDLREKAWKYDELCK